MACRRECRHGQGSYPLCHRRWARPIPDAGRPSVCIGRHRPKRPQSKRREQNEGAPAGITPTRRIQAPTRPLKRPSSRSEQTGEVGCPPPLRRFRAQGGPAYRIGARPCFPTSPVTMCFRLETRRLWLRWPRLADVQAIVRLAGEKAVAEMTARIPHPYDARRRGALRLPCSAIQCGRRGAAAGHHAEGPPERLVGMVGIGPSPRTAAPHLGYWLGAPYWGQGYATEAARALIDAFFAYTAAAEISLGGPGDQPGLAAGAREVRLRLSGLRPDGVQGAGAACFPVDHLRLDRRAWESLKTWGHSGFVPGNPTPGSAARSDAGSVISRFSRLSGSSPTNFSSLVRDPALGTR